MGCFQVKILTVFPDLENFWIAVGIPLASTPDEPVIELQKQDRETEAMV